MQHIVSKSKLKARALHYFRQVERTGRELIVTDRGKPVLKIVPYKADPLEMLRTLKGSVLEYRDPTEPIAVEDWKSLS
ncbi:MAG: type II toxin-antitoxin system Phd/YefM family antitoxin [Acidobacteriota bacterium]